MNQDIKKRAIQRLNIVSGQVKGLSEMISREKYCIDIISQINAVKQALSGAEDLILENHLANCAIKQIRGSGKDRAKKEILKIYKLSRKK